VSRWVVVETWGVDWIVRSFAIERASEAFDFFRARLAKMRPGARLRIENPRGQWAAKAER
jgi:hypothetical protein